MAHTSFDELVQREQQAVAAAASTTVDWTAEKAEWLGRLQKLFKQVEGFLKEYIAAGQVTIAYQNVALIEDNLGTYSAPKMVLTIGTKVVELEPIGTLLIGSKGRVDVVGAAYRAQLLLLDKDVKNLASLIRVSVSINGGPLSPPPPKQKDKIEWTWRILTRPPRRQIVEITKETFLDLLAEIANG